MNERTDKVHEAIEKMMQIRDQRGLSLRDLEAQIGISFSTLAKYEHGAAPSKKQLRLIEQWLECGPRPLAGDVSRLLRVEHWAKFVVLNFAANNDQNVKTGIKMMAAAIADTATN